MLRGGLREDGSGKIHFVETNPPDSGKTVGTQADYEYRYKITEPAPETVSVTEPTSGAETASVEEHAQDADQGQTSE